MASEKPMTTDDLRAWQAHMGYTYDTAAQALGISRSAYADLVAGVTRATGKPREAIDRRTALACAAIAAGLGPWAESALGSAARGR